MSFKVIDNELLEKYAEIWEGVRNLIDKKFESKPVYGDNDKHIKTKIKSYGGEIKTNFQNKETPKCLLLIMLHSVIRANKKYYPQTLLEECKYKLKKNKMKNLIKDDLDSSSSDESDSESDNESDNEYDNDESSD